MKLERLFFLHRSMEAQGIDRCRFGYSHGRAKFDVFFLIDEEPPYVLLFGVKGENFSFEVTVAPGFLINPTLDNDIYKNLCRVLDLKYDPTHPFSPTEFFSQFNQAVPQVASISNKFEPHEIAQYRNVEEADKKYFIGWRNNTIREEQVSEANLLKTKRLISQKAYRRCKLNNISSCWSDDYNKAKEVSLPEPITKLQI